jgi:hypothetical protein
MQKTPDSYTGMTDVKPPILESPLQTRRIAWRRRYAAPAILDTEHKDKDSPGLRRGYLLCNEEFTRNSFRMTNLVVTLLE